MNTPLVWIALLLLLSLGAMRIDWRPGRFKIGYHPGRDVGLKTIMLPGVLTVSYTAIEIKGATDIIIPFEQISGLQVRPFQGMRRFYRMAYGDDEISFAVVRFMIGGWFAQGDYFKAARLEKALAAAGVKPEGR